MDMVCAHSDIDLVKSTLKGYRSRVDGFHHSVYEKTLGLAASIDVEESSPHLAGRQTQRHNIRWANAEDFYRLNLTTPFLDHMITELETRFDSQSSTVVIEFAQLLLAKIQADSPLALHKLPSVMELYEDELPLPRGFDIELNMWSSRWTTAWNKSLVEILNIPVTLLRCRLLPNVHKLMIIMTTIPLTSHHTGEKLSTS